ncbi:MAG TPA: L-histidine N(alpha)-methyltransferase, partial [Salinimicrobium sp.]|nr:L-histidine N(alpha)-methyltransferase [Salinimicrobium sp.]
KKTKILLKYFLKEKFDFKYLPVDISENVLLQLAESLKEELPELEVEIFPGNYAKVLKQLTNYKKRKKVILFLGSNIGNFKKEEAVTFLQSIAGAMEKEDLLFVGFDQKKDPQIIRNAYNDEAGITEAFNKNLLKRINREMDADFDPENFIHWPIYNPETGTVKSFLVSKKEQIVNIKALDVKVNFKIWESIHTENSQKFDEDSVEELSASAGLQILDYFADEKSWYRNYIFKKKEL